MSLAALIIGRHPAPPGHRATPGDARERRPRGTALSRRIRTGLLEGVLDLLAGLLQVAGRLVLLALGLQVAVVRGAAHCGLRPTGQLLGLVFHLVAHDELLSSSSDHGPTRSGVPATTLQTPSCPTESWAPVRKVFGACGAAT